MKRVYAAAALIIMACCSCSMGGFLSEPPKTPQPDLTGVMDVSSRFGIGQVCPVSLGTAWTVEHISGWHGSNYYAEAYAVPLIFQIDGKMVTGIEAYADKRRDLSFILIDAEQGVFSKWYDVAPEMPTVGQRLWIVGYERKDFNRDNIPVIVKSVRHGTIYVEVDQDTDKDAEIKAGTSGSCMVGDDGLTYGVFSHVYYWMDGTGVSAKLRRTGAGQLLAAGWDDIDPKFREGLMKEYGLEDKPVKVEEELDGEITITTREEPSSDQQE